MKLTCPKCRSKSVIADEKIPARGAWARCPQCSERFFIRTAGQSLADLPWPAPEPGNPRPGTRSPDAQRLIERLQGDRAQEYPAEWEYDPSLITVFPQKAASPAPYFIALGLAAISAVAVMLFLFTTASEKAVIPQPETRPAGSLNTYGENELRHDLLTLRRRFQSRANLNYYVDFTGVESRMYKYLLTRLAPAQCQEIRRLHFRSPNPGQGFEVKADCLDSRLPSPPLHLYWRQGSAVISFDGVQDQLKLQMFPSPSPLKDEAPSS